MDKKRFVEELLSYIGGADNVKRVFHCYTRLRFTLKDNSLVQQDKVKAMDGVLNAKYIGDLYAVVVGEQVKSVFEELAKHVSLEEEREDAIAPTVKKKTNIFGMFIAMMSSVMSPIIIAICGSGLIMGIQVMLVNFGAISADSTASLLLNVLGNVGFYWLPFCVASTAADRFQCNRIMSLIIVGVLLHPGIMGMAGGEIASLTLFGVIPIPLINYSSTIIQPLVIVFVLSKLEKWLYKVIPAKVQTIFVPFLEIIILGPLALIVVGPVISVIANWISQAYLWLYNIASIPASAIFAAFYPFMVLTGTHTSFSHIMFFSLTELGVDYIMPLMSVTHCAMAGAALAVYFRTKNEKLKGVAATGALVTGIGLTEPALFGVFMPFKKVMIACMASAAIGGGFYGIFKVSAIALGLSPLGSIPIYFTDTFVYWVIGGVATAVIAFLATFFVAYKPGDEDTVPGYEKKKTTAVE